MAGTWLIRAGVRVGAITIGVGATLSARGARGVRASVIVINDRVYVTV